LLGAAAFIAAESVDDCFSPPHAASVQSASAKVPMRICWWWIIPNLVDGL
jgi:hypothetical protein